MAERLHDTCIETATFAAEPEWVCGPDCPIDYELVLPRLRGPQGNDAYTLLGELRAVADPERDSRREAYRDRERRKAVRALDRYVESMFVGSADVPQLLGMGANREAADRLVESVGDYVLSRIGDGVSQTHHNRHYGADDE